MTDCVCDGTGRGRTYAYIDLANLELIKRFKEMGVRINYAALRQHLIDEYGVDRIMVYDSYDPDSDRDSHDSLHYLLDRLGYKTRLYRLFRDAGDSRHPKQKEVDTSLVAEMVSDACTGITDTVVLLSGDRDMAPGVRIASDHGCRIRLVVFGCAGISNDLKSLADSVDYLEESGVDGLLEFEHPTNISPRTSDDQEGDEE